MVLTFIVWGYLRNPLQGGFQPAALVCVVGAIFFLLKLLVLIWASVFRSSAGSPLLGVFVCRHLQLLNST